MSIRENPSIDSAELPNESAEGLAEAAAEYLPIDTERIDAVSEAAQGVDALGAARELSDNLNTAWMPEGVAETVEAAENISTGFIEKIENSPIGKLFSLVSRIGGAFEYAETAYEAAEKAGGSPFAGIKGAISGFFAFLGGRAVLDNLAGEDGESEESSEVLAGGAESEPEDQGRAQYEAFRTNLEESQEGMTENEKERSLEEFTIQFMEYFNEMGLEGFSIGSNEYEQKKEKVRELMEEFNLWGKYEGDFGKMRLSDMLTDTGRGGCLVIRLIGEGVIACDDVLLSYAGIVGRSTMSYITLAIKGEPVGNLPYSKFIELVSPAMENENIEYVVGQLLYRQFSWLPSLLSKVTYAAISAPQALTGNMASMLGSFRSVDSYLDDLNKLSASMGSPMADDISRRASDIIKYSKQNFSIFSAYEEFARSSNFSQLQKSLNTINMGHLVDGLSSQSSLDEIGKRLSSGIVSRPATSASLFSLRGLTAGGRLLELYDDYERLTRVIKRSIENGRRMGALNRFLGRMNQPHARIINGAARLNGTRGLASFSDSLRLFWNESPELARGYVRALGPIMVWNLSPGDSMQDKFVALGSLVPLVGPIGFAVYHTNNEGNENWGPEEWFTIGITTFMIGLDGWSGYRHFRAGGSTISFFGRPVADVLSATRSGLSTVGHSVNILRTGPGALVEGARNIKNINVRSLLRNPRTLAYGTVGLLALGAFAMVRGKESTQDVLIKHSILEKGPDGEGLFIAEDIENRQDDLQAALDEMSGQQKSEFVSFFLQEYVGDEENLVRITNIPDGSNNNNIIVELNKLEFDVGDNEDGEAQVIRHNDLFRELRSALGGLGFGGLEDFSLEMRYTRNAIEGFVQENSDNLRAALAGLDSAAEKEMFVSILEEEFYQAFPDGLDAGLASDFYGVYQAAVA